MYKNRCKECNNSVKYLYFEKCKSCMRGKCIKCNKACRYDNAMCHICRFKIKNKIQTN